MIKYTIAQKYSVNFKEFTLKIREYFSNNNNSIHKARNELKVISHEDISVVVKSFKVPHLFNRVIYSFFRDSKAKKSYDYSLRLQEYTPQPISYIEFYEKFLLKNSYFISEEFAYDFTIREPLLDANFPDKEAIFQAFARFTLKLHNDGIFHNDYSPGNILIKVNASEYIFKIVDINRMNFMDLDQTMRAKNFSKLWASDAILNIIAQEYCKHYNCTKNFPKDVLYFSNKNKRVKNFKKRLKGKPVND